MLWKGSVIEMKMWVLRKELLKLHVSLSADFISIPVISRQFCGLVFGAYSRKVGVIAKEVGVFIPILHTATENKAILAEAAKKKRFLNDLKILAYTDTERMCQNKDSISAFMYLG